MKARGPQWRWQRACADTTFLLGWRRSLTDFLVAGIPASVAFQALGDEGAAINELIALGAAFLMVFVVRPCIELGWNYLQAPMRVLTDDVLAIRARLEAEPSLPHALSAVDIRLEVLEFVRKGEELLTYGSVPTPYAESWSAEASAFLRGQPNIIDPALTERYLEASGPFAAVTVQQKVAALKAIAEALKPT